MDNLHDSNKSMTTQTEALKLALEALEKINQTMPFPVGSYAIKAIKEALAQPEQDKERCVGCEACIDTACGRDECPKGWLKAPQRTWVGLTDLENAEFVKTMERENFLVAIYDIEKKLKEKNT